VSDVPRAHADHRVHHHNVGDRTVRDRAVYSTDPDRNSYPVYVENWLTELRAKVKK